jgi:ATP-binding cassette subfamily F protein 3
VAYGANVDLGYYDQQQAALHPEKTAMDEIWDDFPFMQPDQVRGALALFLLTGDDVFQPISTLSGGEKGRVALSKLMLRKDNLLILDEPTNHLDMDSREVLEHALDEFTGTILTVSHDRYFINRICSRVVEMRPDGADEYLGNYDDYLNKKRRAEFEEAPAASGVTRTELEKQKRKERLRRESQKALEKRVQELEEAIARAEEEIALLEEKMGDPSTYQGDGGAQVARDHHAAQERLAALMDEWEDAAEVASEQ